MNGRRKFFLTFIAMLASIAFCWYGKITGGQWIEVQMTILGMYKVANIVDKKLGGAG